MTIPEFLRAAADHLEKHGWVQGLSQTPDGRCCAVGALDVVFDSYWLRSDVPHMAAWRALEKTLVLRSIPPYLAKWNDTPGRTKEEVIALFRETADREEAENA